MSSDINVFYFGAKQTRIKIA